jgi:hypothetical protein
MLVEPLVRGVGSRRERATPPAPWPTGYLVALDLAVVGATSRVAGLETSGLRATVIALLALGAGAAGLLVIQHSRRAMRPRRPQRA